MAKVSWPSNIFTINLLLRNLAQKYFSSVNTHDQLLFIRDNYYKQTHREAMGIKMGPSFANLFVGYIELQ